MRSELEQAFLQELEKISKAVKPAGVKIIYSDPVHGSGHWSQAKSIADEAKRQGIPFELVNYDEKFLSPEFRKEYAPIYEGYLKGTHNIIDQGVSHAKYLTTEAKSDEIKKFVQDNKDHAFIVTMPHLQVPFRNVNHPVHILHTDPVKWHAEMDWSPVSENKRIHIGMDEVLKDLKPRDGKLIKGLPVSQSVLTKQKPTGIMDPDKYNITVSGGGLGVEVVPMVKRVLEADLPENAVVHAVAAKDKKQFKQLERMAKKDPRLHPLGFVPLAAMMQEADLNVIRSHGTTFAETVAAGKPAVYYGPERSKLPEFISRATDFQAHLTTDTAEYGGRRVGNPVAIGLDKIPDAVTKAVTEREAMIRKSLRAKKDMGNPAAQTLAHVMKPRPDYEVKEAEEKSVGDMALGALPAVAGVGAGALPIVQGLRTGALGAGPGGKEFKDVKSLKKSLKAGDVLLVSNPGKDTRVKTLATMIGADPHGYHVEHVMKAPGKGRGSASLLHAMPGRGGGAAVPLTESFKDSGHVIVRRFKTEKARKKFLENLRKAEAKDKAVEKSLGARARAARYDKAGAGKAGVKSLLPVSVQRLLNKVDPADVNKATCSGLTGKASPACLMPGVAKADIMPHHIQRTPKLTTVGVYRAPQTTSQMLYDKSMTAAPWLLRGALGLGLGYGAYRGAKALTGED